MAAFYFDTSALAKRYVAETGSSWVARLIDAASGHFVYISRMTSVEIVSAISRRVNTGSLSGPDAAAALNQFRHHFAHEYEIAEITRQILADAMILAEAHTLRAYDAVQLATVQDIHKDRLDAGLPAITLVSSDIDLNAASVEDPNTHP